MREIVDYNCEFREIENQDNPAMIGQECVMIVKRSHLFIVLAIYPNEHDSVNEVASFFYHDDARLFAETNEKWFDRYVA